MDGVSYQGQWMSLRQACIQAGQPYMRVRKRLAAGWSLEAALDTPRCTGRDQEAPGRPLSHRSLAWAIMRYLETHPEEARRLAQKYGWTDT